jgi:hypothetical protein
MTNIINLPNFAEAAKSETTVTILEAGNYELEIREIRSQVIKSGQYAGQPVLNVALVSSTGAWIWKQLPIFAIEADDKKGLTWLRLSTMAFAQATGSKKTLDTEALIGTLVGAQVGVQPRADRPDENQNFVKTFYKLEA